jgi:hypothetical protein
MSEFPWGVVVILSCGLSFTVYCIYYILKLASEEMKDEKHSNHSISNKSSD